MVTTQELLYFVIRAVLTMMDKVDSNNLLCMSNAMPLSVIRLLDTVFFCEKCVGSLLVTEKYHFVYF